MDATTRRVLPMLPVLVALAETGQTIAAADILQMPQSTVSRTLARLGTELGTPVVERHGRGLRLTPAGETLAEHAARVLDAAETGVEAVRAQEAGARGTIALTFQSTLGERVMPALVKAFIAEHPGVRVDLAQTSRPRCLAALADGSAEVAFISPLEERDDLISLRLHTEPLVLVTPTGHHLASKPKITLSEAANEAFICMKTGYGMRTILDQLSTDAGFTPTVAFEGDDLPTVRGLVSAGMGVALAPRAPRGTPGCVEIPLTDPDAVRHIGACWLNQSTSTLTTSFIRLLKRRGRRLTEIGLRPY